MVLNVYTVRNYIFHTPLDNIAMSVTSEKHARTYNAKNLQKATV